MSLIEVVAAITISALIAVTGLAFVRNHGEVANNRACQATRTSLQNDVLIYQQETGRPPTRLMKELADSDYSGRVLPTCPTTGTAYQLQSGQVICTAHPVSR